MKRELLRAPVLQADETPVPVKDPEAPGQTRRAYLWSYGEAGGNVVFDFTLSRSSRGPLEFLSGFEGFLQTDAYAGYDALARQGGVVRLGCWAHVRRKFYEARDEDPAFAELVLAAIQRLYRIERAAKAEGLQGVALLDRRRGESLAILNALEGSLRAKRALPKSAMGQAISYALGQWDDLVRYVEVADSEIDNNACERTLRGVVLGRKNWLFVGHPEAGPRAAVIFSLIESAKRHSLETFEYLRDVIARLARDDALAADLTPRAWREARKRTESEKSGEPHVG